MSTSLQYASAAPVTIEEVARLVESEEEKEKVLGLRGEAAVVFMDQLLKTLDDLRENGKTDKTVSMAEGHLLKVAEHSNQLPSSFLVDNVQCPNPWPVNGGGFADVYKGSHKEKPVALKVLRIYVTGAVLTKIQRSFYNEAFIWRQLNHPNVLSFLGISQTLFAGRPCMISPWMQNGTLLEYLEAHPSANRKKLLFQVTSGLLYLHERNPAIVHGDLRGANVLVTEQGEACVADFGLALLAESLAAMTFSSSKAPGNPRWLPPELLRPGSAEYRRNPAVDAYSFAGLCYEVYTGNSPYHEQRNDFVVLLEVLNGVRPERPPANTTQEELPDAVWDCMTQCWSDEPTSRPSTSDLVSVFREAESRTFTFSIPVFGTVSEITVAGQRFIFGPDGVGVRA
ncbi:kinase-like domain-containing protein [Mycena olivaceomarginata]|nr:kinase-like domain-containing protein [Mycena olivaceomarginata]